MVGIIPVDPECGHFIRQMIRNNGQRAVLQPGLHGTVAAENLLHLFRQGGSADIPVMGFHSQQGIPDAAAYGIRRKAGLLQAGQQFGNGCGKRQ